MHLQAIWWLARPFPGCSQLTPAAGVLTPSGQPSSLPPPGVGREDSGMAVKKQHEKYKLSSTSEHEITEMRKKAYAEPR